MDSFLSAIGRFVPVIFSLLSLWIKAFDSKQRLTRPGKFILTGLALSAILVYSADQLDKRLSKIASDREKKEALYEQNALFRSVQPGDVILKLNGRSESVRPQKHPKHLFHEWRVALRGALRDESDDLWGAATDGDATTESENDEEVGTVFSESRSFSRFNGDFKELVKEEAWNGAEFTIVVNGSKKFFPETLADWKVKDKDSDFASNARKKIEGVDSNGADGARESKSQIENSSPVDGGEWRMLPMSIHAELLVKGRRVAESEGYIESFRLPGAKRRTVRASLSLNVPEDAFLTKNKFVPPTKPEDLASCTRWRIIAWVSCLLAITCGVLAADVQLRPKVAPFVPKPGEEVVVNGTIGAISTVPLPGTVPYQDHILALHLTELAVEGRPATEALESLVYLESMRDNVLTPAARLRPGDHVKLRLRAWTDVSDRYEKINRSEIDDPAVQLEEPAWGELINN